MQDNFMPSDPELEMSVLGSIIVPFVEIRSYVMTRIKRDHFFSPKNQLVFDAITYFYNDNKEFDLVSLESYMYSNGTLEKVGVDYLVSLTKYASSYGLFESHCEMLIEFYVARMLRIKLVDIHGKLNPSNVMECIDDLSEFVIGGESEDIDISQGMTPQEIMDFYKDKPQAEQLFTGNDFIDNVMYKDGGMRKGQTCLTIADSSHGKTQYAHMVHSLLAKRGYKTAWFQLESTAEDTAKALINLCGDSAKNIYIHDKIYDIDQIKRWTRKHVKLKNIDCVVVDYVQNVVCTSPGKKNESMEYISTQLTRLAKDLNIAGHFLSQVTIEKGQRKGWNRFPRYNDVRDSQQLKQDAAVMAAVFAPFVLDELQSGNDALDWKDRPIDKRSKFVKQVKNRFGELSSVMEHYLHTDQGLRPYEAHRQEVEDKNNAWRYQDESVF